MQEQTKSPSSLVLWIGNGSEKAGGGGEQCTWLPVQYYSRGMQNVFLHVTW